jgi:hypothetical protein
MIGVIPYPFQSITNDGNGNVEGYYDHPGPGCYNVDSPNNHGMNDRFTEGIIQNIGFDVNAHFDTMVSEKVDPADALIIRHNWCKQSTDNINTAKCTNFYATPEAQQSGFRYDQDLFYLCKADPKATSSFVASTFHLLLKGDSP